VAGVPGVYVVEGRLGRGGMGVVELGVAPDGTRVALKRVALYGSEAQLAAARARIRREAEVLGRLDHEGIVRLLDVVDDGDDLVLVMPLLDGGSLADRVSAGGPLPAAQVARVGDRLLRALAAAHRAGVVHRDVKPANVLFDDHDAPHLADFGIATARDVTAGLTMTAAAVGTPGFLAPEQARGEPAGPAADVFSLGATLRWAVTGVGPYGEGPPDVLLWRASKGKVDTVPRSVPGPLRRRIDAMLEARPEKRPTAAALAGGPTGTAERPTTHRAPDQRQRRRRLVSAAALVVAVALSAVGLWILARPSARPATASPDDPAATATTLPATTTTACAPLPYQPCGAVAPAAGTDGRVCLEGFADYDADAANGCEAVADTLDGAALDEVLTPTIVPADDVDEFAVDVGDGFQLLCDGEVRLTITAPTGMALRLSILDTDGTTVAEQTSVDGDPGEVRLRDPSCFSDDARVLTARVTAVGSDRTGAPYRIERSGSF
jgi:hypothetical protein